MIPGIMLLVWALGFWPAVAAAYFVAHSAGVDPMSVLSKDSPLAFAAIWMMGSAFLYEVYQRGFPKPDDDPPEVVEEEEDDEPNVRLIVEASQEELNATGCRHLQCDVRCEAPPQNGARLVLASGYVDDGAILGTVVEVAQVAARDDAIEYHVWVVPDLINSDFEKLNAYEHWVGGDGEMRRSTSPVLEPKPEPEASPA